MPSGSIWIGTPTSASATDLLTRGRGLTKWGPRSLKLDLVSLHRGPLLPLLTRTVGEGPSVSTLMVRVTFCPEKDEFPANGARPRSKYSKSSSTLGLKTQIGLRPASAGEPSNGPHGSIEARV